MAIEKWQPFGSVRDFDDAFNRFLGVRPVRSSKPTAWSIPVDVVQDEDAVVVTASVPGTTKDEIDVSVDENVLTIKAESASSTDEESNGYLLRERRTGFLLQGAATPRDR